MSQWLHRVWGPNEEDAPAFETLDQAQHIMGLILRQLKRHRPHSLQDDPDDFEPVFNTMTYPRLPGVSGLGDVGLCFMQGIGPYRED